jgi:hypothetical protein
MFIWDCEPCSSGSIVSGYGLDDRAIEVRSLAEPNEFSSSLCVQTGSGAYPASCTIHTGGCEISGSHGGEYDVQNCLHHQGWWWRQYAPLKRRSTIILHGSTSQKTILNIIPGVLSPALKRGRGVTLTTYPIYCRGQEWVEATPPLPWSASVACSGTDLALTYEIRNYLTTFIIALVLLRKL